MKLSKLKKGDVVLIKWVDSYSNTRWMTDDEVKYWEKSLLACVSIGCVFNVNKHSIILYGDQSPSEKGRFMSIPKSVVQKVKLLK